MTLHTIPGNRSLSVLNLRGRRQIARRHVSAAAHVDTSVLYTTISAGMILIRRYLVAAGATGEFADRYGSAFGRVAAKTYRAERDAEPRKAWSSSTGKWRRVMGYLPTDTAVLDRALAAYPRTAHLAANRTQRVEYVHAPNGAEFATLPADSYEVRMARNVRQLVMADGRTWKVGAARLGARSSAPIAWLSTGSPLAVAA
ncbi:hypothetical protein [Streptomyces sp. NPDC048644]|uniref:hypothetical protein n=1 Tax=Streptomyces sp. NPDC048644 TaxID=3365582 RepID=UPI003719F397